MKAVTCTNAKLEVVDRPSPAPAKGQLLLDVLRCGICGSDLHARLHCDELADVMAESGYHAFMRSNQQVVFGHEFCGEVVDYGPGTRRTPRRGTPVVAMPLLRRGNKEVHGIGLSTMAPGAYAERLVVEQSLTFPVPNGLAPEIAALTEPMAVGWHAVRRGEVGKGDVAIVIGCGPIGLAVICMLKSRGVHTVIASDFSPGRRALATACGADSVVDPVQDSPYAVAAGLGQGNRHLQSILDAFDLAVGTVERLQGARHRSPGICTSVPNLLLAGEVIYSPDLTLFVPTMEKAACSGYLAARQIMNMVASHAAPLRIDFRDPAPFAVLRRVDRWFWSRRRRPPDRSTFATPPTAMPAPSHLTDVDRSAS